jgi:capsular exopolysaccharide synthesis family protein
VLPRDTAVAETAGAVPGALRARVVGIARRWRLVLAITAVAVGGTYGVSSLRPTEYRATAVLRVGGTAGTPSSTAPTRDEELRRFPAPAVRAAVAKVDQGGLDPTAVHARPDPHEPDALRASAVGRHPRELAELVNLYVATFVDVRRTERIDALRAQEATIRRRFEDTTRRLTAARAPLDALTARVAAEPANAALADQRDALARRLAPTLTPLTSTAASLQAQLQELDARVQATYASGYEVVRAAPIPRHPIAPRPVRDAAAAGVVGLFAAALVASALDALDQRGLEGADLDQLTGGLPVLGRVPFVPEEVGEDHVAVRDQPLGPLGAAYRALAAQLGRALGPAAIVQVTSSAAGEGKTTAVANLAEALARPGRRVGVLCADLRRPRLEACLGVAPAPGLVEVLEGQVELAAALQRTPGDVVVLPAGGPGADPAELLAGARLVTLVQALADQVDVLLLDCPPVLPVTDALLVARLADVTVVVADARTTERRALAETLDRLHQIGATVLGLVLNSQADDGASSSPDLPPTRHRTYAS